MGSGVPVWSEAQETDVEKVFLDARKALGGKGRGRETGKDEEGKVTSTLSNEQLHRFWGTTPWHRELQLRPLQTYKKWCVDPDRHAQAVVAMFGQLIVCKERCERDCGMAEEGSFGQLFGEGDAQRGSCPASEGVAGEVVTGGCAQDQLLVNLELAGTFDFLYVPVDFRNNCNIGYAVIIFRDIASCHRFAAAFHGIDMAVCFPCVNIGEGVPSDTSLCAGFGGKHAKPEAVEFLSVS